MSRAFLDFSATEIAARVEAVATAAAPGKGRTGEQRVEDRGHVPSRHGLRSG
jgi:hypothetical protein